MELLVLKKPLILKCCLYARGDIMQRLSLTIASILAEIKNAHPNSKTNYYRFSKGGSFLFDLKKEIKLRRDLPIRAEEITNYARRSK